jgi:hypothetical protein
LRNFINQYMHIAVCILQYANNQKLFTVLLDKKYSISN